jgi:ubiquinol-cytochrome c reductase cytochrome b subunit
MRTFRARLGDWIEERTGLRTAMRVWIDAPAVAMDVGTQLLGAAVSACFAVLVLTGVVLMSTYDPSPESAWASTHYVQFMMPHGWIVRGLHYWAAQALFVLAPMHILYGAIVAIYRPRAEVAWWLTLLVAGLAVAQGITGGLLPWDQRGWWARSVEATLVGLTPLIGGWLQRMVSGGPELGALGLTRAYAIHAVVLPVILAGALWARHALLLREGRTSAGTVRGVSSRIEQLAPSVAMAVAVAFGIFALTASMGGASLDAPADPTSDYPARPEWFLQALYELRKCFRGPAEFWGVALVPVAVVTYLVLLPWLDRPPRVRIIVLAPLVLSFGAAVLFSLAAIQNDARDPKYVKARASARAQADAAVKLAMNGVPPAGALEMMRNDPELRGRDLFEKQCASCHVLAGLGDPSKATAAKLDGWGTSDWIEAVMHDPDAREFFGGGPYFGQMPSVDMPPSPPRFGVWSPMVNNVGERHAIAVFLASEGEEPGPRVRPRDDVARQGEKLLRERCLHCHLYKGDGDQDGSGLAPELTRYGSIAWTQAQVANPSSPQTYRDRALDPVFRKHMPRFDDELSPADVDLVARWTQAHARGTGPLP